MDRNLIFPNPDPTPDPGEFIRPPTIYVKRDPVWLYHHVVRNLTDQQPLDETELNTLGAEGWELAGVLTHASQAHYYFKRLAG